MAGVFLGKETSADELVPGSQTRLEMVPSMSSHRGSPIPKQTLSKLVYLPTCPPKRVVLPALLFRKRTRVGRNSESWGGMLVPRMTGRILERVGDSSSTLKHSQRECISPSVLSKPGRGAIPAWRACEGTSLGPSTLGCTELPPEYGLLGRMDETRWPSLPKNAP